MSSNNPNIPPRTSSKAAVLKRRDELSEEIETSSKRLKTCGSFDHDAPRDYKIRILERKAREMQGKIQQGSDLRWLDLDNKMVQFRSDHRPRARYLNYLYLVTMLRRSWNSELTNPADVLKDELGKPWWGTRTRRMRSSELLQAIIEEGGHDYHALGPGSDEVGEEGDEGGGKGKGKGKAKDERLEDMEKDLVVGTANAHIASSLLRRASEEEGLNFDSDSDDEDE